MNITIKQVTQIFWFPSAYKTSVYTIPQSIKCALALWLKKHVCAQLCPTLCGSMGCSPPGSSVHGIFLARILEWVATFYCRASSQPRDQIHVSCISCTRGFVFVVQYLSGVWFFVTPWSAGHHASLSWTISQSLLKLMSIESAMPSNISFCLPLLLLPSVFPSTRVFSNEKALCIRWPKYWSFSFSISSSKEYSWLISFGIDWLDLLTVQGTLKSLLQHHSSKASILSYQQKGQSSIHGRG